LKIYQRQYFESLERESKLQNSLKRMLRNEIQDFKWKIKTKLETD